MYEVRANQTWKLDNDGERVQLANFAATIVEETRYWDGYQQETVLVITGKQGTDEDEIDLPAVTVPADKFPGLAWVMPAWGVRAVVMPGGSVKEDLRTAIQVMSKPAIRTIYTHTGWQEHDGKWVYLHASGCVTCKGDDPSLTVQLPHELQKYCLHCPEDTDLAECVATTVALHQIGPDAIGWALVGAIVAPVLGPVDFAIHIAGRTGTYKSEIASLAQSHYGATMDARHLPANWSSTANALEALAYRTKNAIISIDDFIPSGTTWQLKSYQKTADQIIRGAGNQAGRARLTDMSSLQQTMYPRGMILSTGEDIPEGHSVRARMLILELSPGDISLPRLSAFQSARCKFPGTIAAFVRAIAPDYPAVESAIAARAAQIRDAHLDVGHSRTPSMIGRLIASLEFFLRWAASVGAHSQEMAESLIEQATKTLIESASDQDRYLVAADPCQTFCETLKLILQTHAAHVRTLSGGIPRNPTMLGWTQEDNGGDVPQYRSHGKTIGWVISDKDELYLDHTLGYELVRKQGQIALTKATLIKRMRDAALLLRTDEARQRNTVRITAEGHPHQCIALSLSGVLGAGDEPD